MGKRNIKKKKNIIKKDFFHRGVFQYLLRALLYPIQNKVMLKYFFLFTLLSFGSLALQGGILYRVGIDKVVFRTIHVMLPFLIGGFIWGIGLHLINLLQEGKAMSTKLNHLSFENFQEGLGIVILVWFITNITNGETLILKGTFWVFILMVGAYFARSRDWDVLWRFWAYGKMFLLNWKYLLGGIISLNIIQLFYTWINLNLVNYQQSLIEFKIWNFILILLLWLWIALGTAYKNLFLINLIGNLELVNKQGKANSFTVALKSFFKYTKKQIKSFI